MRGRRSVLKGMLGIAGAALASQAVRSDSTEAARRPTPTPKPISCPGNQIPCADGCCCPDGSDKCGPACCPADAQCCDNACCHGECYGEELCCAAGRLVCAGANGVECCPEGQECCDGVCADSCESCVAEYGPANPEVPCCADAPITCEGYCNECCPDAQDPFGGDLSYCIDVLGYGAGCITCDSNEHRCTPFREAYPCDIGDQRGFCSSGYCRPCRENGAECSDQVQCCSLYCSGGHCVPPPA